MATWKLNRPGGPWDYPTLGFLAAHDAVLIAAAAPDRFWAAVADGPPETVVRYGLGTGEGPGFVPVPDGSVLAYDAPSQRYLPRTPLDFVHLPAVQEVIEGTARAAVTARYGTGSPEGVVTAPVGSRYVDTAATAGAVEWIKASGTGNTGWRVTFGDTGWRKIAATGANLTGFFLARRVGDVVDVKNMGLGVDNAALTGALASGVIALALPTGLRPKGDLYLNWGVGNVQPTRLSSLSEGGQLALWAPGAETAGAIRITVTTFTTTNPWPATLPGSAA